MCKESIKIYIYNSTLAYGGAERVTIYLAENFKKYKNVNVSIITNKIAANEYIMSKKCSRISLYNKEEKENTLGIIIKLRKLIKAEKPDIVLVMGTTLMIYAVPALLGLPSNIIVSERNSPQNFSGKRITFIATQILLRFTRGFVFQTNEAGDFYKNIKCFKKVIANPLFDGNIPDKYNGKRNKEIVSVGRLYKQKNHELLIKAFMEIAGRYPEYHLTIYGEGPERSYLENLIDILKLNERVFLPGAFSDVLLKIRKASLFALSSDFEGMPNALIEAMALGLPVVSTDSPSGGPRELIDDKKNGILVPTNNISALANAMDLVLSNPKMAESISIEAFKIREKLNANVIVNEWLKFCYDVKNAASITT